MAHGLPKDTKPSVSKLCFTHAAAAHLSAQAEHHKPADRKTPSHLQGLGVPLDNMAGIFLLTVTRGRCDLFLHGHQGA